MFLTRYTVSCHHQQQMYADYTGLALAAIPKNNKFDNPCQDVAGETCSVVPEPTARVAILMSITLEMIRHARWCSDLWVGLNA